MFVTLACERARPSRAKIDTGAWLSGNAIFLRFCRVWPAVACRWLAWACGGDVITSDWGRARDAGRQEEVRGGGSGEVGACDNGGAGFHAGVDLFERGWGWGSGEEEVKGGSSGRTVVAAARKGEHWVRGRGGRSRRGASP